MGKFLNKVVLITGASRGLGSALAHGFAKEGATLILMARRVEGLEAIDKELDQYNVETTLVPLDLSKPERLQTLPQALMKKFGRLDVLVGNAGMLGNLSPLTHYAPRNFQKIMNVNVTANWHLMTGLEALLKNSAAPREIFITTSVNEKATPYWGPYVASKAALNMMVKTYAQEMRRTSFRINLVDPGDLQTDMFEKAMPGVDLSAIKMPQDIVPFIMDLALESCDITGKIITL